MKKLFFILGLLILFSCNKNGEIFFEFENGDRKLFTEFTDFVGIVNFTDSMVCEMKASLLFVNDDKSEIKIVLLNNCIERDYFEKGCSNPLMISMATNISSGGIHAKLPKRIKKEKISEYVFNPRNRVDFAESPKKACFKIYLPDSTGSRFVNDLVIELITIFEDIKKGTPIDHSIPIKFTRKGLPPPPP